MPDSTLEAAKRREQPEPDMSSAYDDQELALAMYMNSLGLELRDHYHDTSGEEQTLEEAADMAERATFATSNQDPNLPRYYNDLGLILWDLYYHNECFDTLEQAITAVKKAIDLTSKTDMNRVLYLDRMSYMLYDRGSLKESFEAAKEVVQDCPENHEERYACVDWFGRVLYDLTLDTGSIHELEHGLDTVRQSVNSIPADKSYRAQCLSTLSGLLHEQYGVRSGNIDPAEAVQIARDAIAAEPEDSLERATYLYRLGLLLSEIFYFTRAGSDIEESVKLLRQATAEYYDGDTEWPSRWYALGSSLAHRSIATGSPEDLDESISIIREIIELLPKDHERHLKISLHLASLLKERYIQTKAQSDFDEAIRVVEINLAVAPEDHPERGRAFHILGNAVGERFNITGSMDDLDESIKHAQNAVQATPETHPEFSVFIMSLASGLSDRFGRIARLADLDEAIRLCERALEETSETRLSWIPLLHNMAGSYRNRFQRCRKISDLERSIELGQTTVDRCRRDDVNRHLYLSGLAISLKTRFRYNLSMEDLDTAIDLEKETLEITPTDHIDHASKLHAVGISVSLRYKQKNDVRDLEEAINFEKRALDAMDEGHYHRAESLSSMGIYLLLRSEITGNKDDGREAARLYEKAILQTQSSVQDRMEAARNVMYIYREQEEWQLAYEAAAAAIDMIPQLILRSLGNADKQELLKKVSGLSSDAAGLALQLGKGPAIALDMLERGRGLLAASIDELHTNVNALREEFPELATKFVSLRDQLGRDDLPQRESSSAWNQASDKRHKAGEKFDKLIAEIRGQPGFEDFLLPPTECKIKETAECGPIIVVNTSFLRCDAIIIETDQILSVPLPKFDRQDMMRFVREGTLRSSLALEWLWTCIASPVLNALGFVKTPDSVWPHVWWVMTGLLSKFPIHAAGEHSNGRSDTVLDRVISSYQNSVQSIIRGRKQPFKVKPLQQALLVGMEKTPGSSYLPNARNEVTTVRKVCESMSIKTVEPGPVKAAITSQLLQSEIFHYAGHAYTDGHDPAESYLCLGANKADCLTVSNLLDINLQRQSPFLAYLSACGTGEIQYHDLADEGIHLITAFQLLGFRHVIGTLWAVMDSLCVEYARLVYEYLRYHGTSDRAVAEGLHHAAKKARDAWFEKEKNQRTLSKRVRNMAITEGVGSGGGQEVTRNAGTRDVIACEDNVEWPDWIPYVHVGV
ncbi:hypothetical protein FVEN_g3780 [Fusarium venenatum]|uniref:CHAT domain-containing protein n=1 Tax=Fusarium venenatum TaxID=56646 RepID=A0A2L2T486_9HYPO|nr:uncharacterized protein FVRRES_13754 [Fusarium venenatum]KAG8358708.1 hypothetical protein FVEN_g3780 [Fusarium venenatum]KAH6980261.1 CHAT domain-containing protein [Fusarium venenatum]CEI41812.1 unnamed protein product [Fusarium venenatum]